MMDSNIFEMETTCGSQIRLAYALSELNLASRMDEFSSSLGL
jgi:hypothetical protein